MIPEQTIHIAMTDRIRRAEALPEIADAVEALHELPIAPRDAMAVPHGMALFRTARRAEAAGELPLARQAYHGAAQRLPADTLYETHAVNGFARLAAATRSSRPAVDLRGALADAVATTRGSPRLLTVVGQEFAHNFEKATQVDLEDALNVTIKVTHRNMRRRPDPAILDTIVEAVAGKLDRQARIDLPEAIRSAERLCRLESWLENEHLQDALAPRTRERLAAVERQRQGFQGRRRGQQAAALRAVPRPSGQGNVVHLRR